MDKVLKASRLPKNNREEGFVDRLSSRYTVSLLVIFAVVVSLTSWVRKPIWCWFPKYVTKYQRRYGHSYCWVANTYYLPYNEYVPRIGEDDKRRTIRYYQWIPWILLTQAFFFWLPGLVWRQLSSKAGIDVADVFSSVRLLQNTQQLDRRDVRLRFIGKMLDRFLLARKEYASGCKSYCSGLFSALICQCSGRRFDCYTVAIYMMTKFLYLVNIVGQAYALSALLQIRFWDYGPLYVQYYHGNNTSGTYFRNSPIFPRITMCDITVRYLGNVQRHTVQCVLALNYYLEKMYLFFWLWLIFLLLATGLDIIVWFCRFLIRRDRLNFVRNHLNAGNYLTSDWDRKMTGTFLDEYLRQDGAFLLRMIAHNTNTITTADVVGTLWLTWKERRMKEEAVDEEAPLNYLENCVPPRKEEDDAV